MSQIAMSSVTDHANAVLRHIMRRLEKMNELLQGILSGLAAIFVAEVAFFWPSLSGEKASRGRHILRKARSAHLLRGENDH
jgi:hypothetical protein